MVFNVTFNNISAILWRSVLLVEETRVPGETLSHNVVSSRPRLSGIQTLNISGDTVALLSIFLHYMNVVLNVAEKLLTER